MLNLITDIFKPNERVDPLFGVVKFRRTFGIVGTGFWQGEINFAPLGKLVEVYITVGKGGILESQRDFYRQVEQRYSEIIDDAHKVLHETLLQYMQLYFSKYTLEEILQDCELNSIYIPSFKETDTEWGLSFIYIPHKESYTVYFDGWKPIYGKFDD
jgi:hypothetical protein